MAPATADINGTVKEYYPYRLEEVDIKPPKTEETHSWLW